jgi:predicted transcriptional regulator YdeE
MLKETPVALDGLTVVGVTVRTTNRAEADPGTAKIPALWQRFFVAQEAIPHRREADVIIGVYTGYESDHTGEYSLIVGSEVSAATDVPDDLVSVAVSPGRYLVFTAEGEMPGALIRTWMEIWEYFSATSKYQRAYTADFERHDRRRPSAVAVYVALR